MIDPEYYDDWFEVYSLLRLATEIPIGYVEEPCPDCRGGVCSDCGGGFQSYCTTCRYTGVCPTCRGHGVKMEQGVQWDA